VGRTPWSAPVPLDPLLTRAWASVEGADPERDLFPGVRLRFLGPLDVDAKIVIATLEDRNTRAAHLINPDRQV
jgi:hypothetical protein